jgi:signal-transduction protein with cAMP-binding, CBS, and nucleotidyltransferase domain
MQVSEILERKGRDVVTVRPGATVQAAVATLAKRGIGAVVVSRDGRSIDGILSERDLVRGISRHGADYLGRRVDEVTVHKVYTCAPGDDIHTVMAEMKRRKIRHLPVAVHGMLAGMVSVVDILREHCLKQEWD